MSEEEIIGKLKLWMECASINNGNSCIVNKAELQGLLDLYDKEKEKIKEIENTIPKSKAKEEINGKFKEAKGLYERGVQPQAQYTMKLLRDLEQSLLGKE